jgi:hypothetical protein
VTDGGESAQLQSRRCAADDINQVSDLCWSLALSLTPPLLQVFFGEPSIPPTLSGNVTISPIGDGSQCLGLRAAEPEEKWEVLTDALTL